MFGIDVKTFFDAKPLVDARDQATVEVLEKRSAAIEADVKASIHTSNEPSPEGSPPHTRGKSGHNLRDSIERDVSGHEALIGPSHAMVGELGEAFEFGREYRGDEMGQRPFMEPVLEQHTDPFASDFAGSIGT